MGHPLINDKIRCAEAHFASIKICPFRFSLANYISTDQHLNPKDPNIASELNVMDKLINYVTNLISRLPGL